MKSTKSFASFVLVASAALNGLLVPAMVHAQEQQSSGSSASKVDMSPLGKSASYVVDYTQNVSSAFSGDVNGRDYQRIAVQFLRTEEGLERWAGPTSTLLIDPKTLFFVADQFGDGKIADVEDKNTRNELPLSAKMAWKSDRTIQAAAVPWCKDTKSRVDSKFETLPAEKYSLKINGQDASIDVIPVVERGYWYRCYSGKRYSRILVSKELNAVVSVAYLTYDPTGNLHSSSNRVNVVEINR